MSQIFLNSGTLIVNVVEPLVMGGLRGVQYYAYM